MQILLDCSLRDGGYYNNWDFPEPVINRYLKAISEAGVDVVELGLRSLENRGFKGACAFTTDDFINGLKIPANLKVGVMINASELLDKDSQEYALKKLFPNDASNSPVNLVRIACHIYEVAEVLPVVPWLKQCGFTVGLNLMQIADRTDTEIKDLAALISQYPVDVLYFADSMGSMTPKQTERAIGSIRTGWEGAIGIHTHDNLGLALSNTLSALHLGVTWVDSTVTGMGRGPGNARTEELAIEMAEIRNEQINLIPLMELLDDYFKPLQSKFKWGTNPYYYLSGKYGIHPSYVQQMQGDSRFTDVDILAVINQLREDGGKKFSIKALDTARHLYRREAKGTWNPREIFEGRDVLILGSGPSVAAHNTGVERFIEKFEPIVIALNTQTEIKLELINYRIACHPVRLLADCKSHAVLPQPLITPLSMLPDQVRSALSGKKTLDYGISEKPGFFETHAHYCVLPNSLVVAYALAVVTAGSAANIYVAGFDGYGADDPRTEEVEGVFMSYFLMNGRREVTSLTPSQYSIPTKSIYAM